MESHSAKDATNSKTTNDTTNELKTNKLSYFSYVNIRGLKPKTVPSKVDLISDIVHDDDKLFFALSETWLHKQKDAEI